MFEFNDIEFVLTRFYNCYCSLLNLFANLENRIEFLTKK